MAWIAVVPPSPRHPHERYQVCYREGMRQRSAGIFPTRRRAEAERRAIERGRTELVAPAEVDLQRARALFGDYVATKWWPAWKDQHPTSEYLDAARQTAAVAHHLLLLTATPHRGNEHFFRALANLLEPALYPWSPKDTNYGGTALQPSELHFLRRMKEDLRGFDDEPLFPPRHAEARSVGLSGVEQDMYDAVMACVDAWYGRQGMLARSIYGKRAASSLTAVYQTLRRRQEALSTSQAGRAEPVAPRGFDVEEFTGAALEDDEAREDAERAIVQARSRDRKGELQAVEALLERLGTVLACEWRCP
jgi:hypothetical protein